jgi:hypothetical protein
MTKILKKIIDTLRTKPYMTRSQEWSMFRQSKDFRI